MKTCPDCYHHAACKWSAVVHKHTPALRHDTSYKAFCAAAYAVLAEHCIEFAGRHERTAERRAWREADPRWRDHEDKRETDR